VRARTAVVITAVLTALIVFGAFSALYRYTPAKTTTVTEMIYSTKTIYATTTTYVTSTITITQTTSAGMGITLSNYTLLVPNGTAPAMAESTSSQWPSSMMAAAYVGDGYVMLTPYPWNSKEWSGKIDVSYNGSAAFAFVDEAYRQKYNPSAPVLGYPSLRYGCDPLFSACTAVAPILPLPMPVNEVGHVYSVLDYELHEGTCNITDFSYDIWINHGSGLTAGDYEVMLWLYYAESPASSSWYTDLGGGYLTLLINGSLVQEHVEVYAHFYANPWSLIIVTLDKPIANGSVGVDLGQLFSLVNSLISKQGHSLNGLQLTSIDIGLEYDGTPNANLTCSYVVNKWALAYAKNKYNET
jgi:hypothetical protein